MNGDKIHALARRLWGFNRSITGDGVRETLSVLREMLPELSVHEVPSGAEVFDWTVPREWRARDAWIITPNGEKICDFKKNNLHLVGYSAPVKTKMRLADLQERLHSLPELPSAIPYITAYYSETWGFCLTHDERGALEDGEYEIFIDSELFDGALTYGELVLPGRSKQEVFLSTYVCHPSMANDNLSGLVVTAFLAEWLMSLENRKFTYRIVFIPETIGSITYLSRHIDHLKSHVAAGFVVTSAGDDRGYSYLPSRRGDTLSDITAQHVLKHICPSFKTYAWSNRGSDERQYCAPGVDLPMASIMRSMYRMYDEYHTSLDDLESVVTPTGLEGGFNALMRAIESLEKHCYPKVTVLCEPRLGKRGLYPEISAAKAHPNEDALRLLVDLITWSDGTKSLLEIAELCGVPVWDIHPVADMLCEQGLLTLDTKPANS